MGLGKMLHDRVENADGGGTIDHPRAYEIMTEVGFLGRRREIYTRLAALSGARPGDHVVDVGCGTGYLTRIMARVVGPDGRVTGVDPSLPVVEHARRRSAPNCSYVVAEGQATDLPDACADVVVSSLAVHHIPVAARDAAVGEMFRVLRPGGRLLIAEYRPPANPLTARLVGALTGMNMRLRMRDLLGDLVPRAGFEVLDEGDLPIMLSYVRARRPQA